MIQFLCDSGTAPINYKTAFTRKIYSRGMAPIEKNVKVIDEQGNCYEATYPKRAKGLVKNGRARFIDENMICLACPPNQCLEDNNMSDTAKKPTPEAAMNLNDEINHALQNGSQAGAGEIVYKNSENDDDNLAGLSMDWVLQRIDKIINDTEYVRDAMDQLADMNTGAVSDDIGSAQKAEAIGEVVRHRETTNQQTLKFLEKMYDDLKSQRPSESTVQEKLSIEVEALRFERIYELAEGLPPIQKDNFIRALAGLPENENAIPGVHLKKVIKQVMDEVQSAVWDEMPAEVRNAITQGITAQLSRNW